MSNDHSHHQRAANGGFRGWVFWGFVLIAAFFLLAEHRAHVFQYLPFVLLLACLLMHLFHGHGGHGGHGSGPKEQRAPEDGSGRADEPAKKPGSGSSQHH